MPTRRTTKYYIGIDIGTLGAIVILRKDSNEVHDIYPMPAIGKVIDILALKKILYYYRSQECHVVFEDLHAIFGSSAGANFTFGFNAGVVESMVVSLGLPYTRVTAKVWQKEMFVGVPLLQKPSSSKKTMINDTKKMALIAAKRLFPKANLLATPRSKVPHNGIVDALLISAYAKRKLT